MPANWKAEIETAHEQTEQTVESGLGELAERNIRPRLLGVLYVVLGVILSTVGNLV
jgi:hypothetical protein